MVTQDEFLKLVDAADVDFDEFDEETSFTVAPESASTDETLFSAR